MNRIFDAIYDFKIDKTAKYNIQPTRIYLGVEDYWELLREIKPHCFVTDIRTGNIKEIMGLKVFRVYEERHIHVC